MWEIRTEYEKKSNHCFQRDHLENTTVTLERVTENYLEGEQRICDIWAHYISNKSMTMEEAVGFIRMPNLQFSVNRIYRWI